MSTTATATCKKCGGNGQRMKLVRAYPYEPKGSPMAQVRMWTTAPCECQTEVE